MISQHNASLFKHDTLDLEYLIALELDSSMKDEFLWVENIDPRPLECILPAETKKVFQSFVNKVKSLTFFYVEQQASEDNSAKKLCNELGVDYYVINGSDEGRFLDTVRNNASNLLRPFRSKLLNTKSSSLMRQITQPMTYRLLLRASIESLVATAILFCNYKNKIIEPLHSRCSVVDFGIKGGKKQQIAAIFFDRCAISQREEITFSDRVVAEVVQKHFPDFRRVLNELRYSSSGTIDTGILASLSEVRLEELTKALKDKEFSTAESGSYQILTMILMRFCVLSMTVFTTV